MDYAVHPADSRVIYLCTTGVKGADGAVYATNNGGGQWSKVLERTQVLPDWPSDRFHAFAPYLHPLNPNVVLVATNTHGAWVSKDAGASWARFDAVPFRRVHRFTLDPKQPAQLFVATHGAGVFEVPLT